MSRRRMYLDLGSRPDTRNFIWGNICLQIQLNKNRINIIVIIIIMMKCSWERTGRRKEKKRKGMDELVSVRDTDPSPPPPCSSYCATSTVDWERELWWLLIPSTRSFKMHRKKRKGKKIFCNRSTEGKCCAVPVDGSEQSGGRRQTPFVSISSSSSSASKVRRCQSQ